jgi:hypothetical protein
MVRRSRAPAAIALATVATVVLVAGAYFIWFGRGSPPATGVPSFTVPSGPEPAATSASPNESVEAPPARSAVEPAVEPAPETVAPLDEDGILDGIVVPDAVRAYRHTQIGGALLAYVSNRQEFDECVARGCNELANHMARVQEALDGYPWQNGGVSGRLRVANPRRLERADCAYLLDVVEELTAGSDRREQTRSYCTSNGFDRVLQATGDVHEV